MERNRRYGRHRRPADISRISLPFPLALYIIDRNRPGLLPAYGCPTPPVLTADTTRGGGMHADILLVRMETTCSRSQGGERAGSDEGKPAFPKTMRDCPAKGYHTKRNMTLYVSQDDNRTKARRILVEEAGGVGLFLYFCSSVTSFRFINRTFLIFHTIRKHETNRTAKQYASRGTADYFVCLCSVLYR